MVKQMGVYLLNQSENQNSINPTNVITTGITNIVDVMSSIAKSGIEARTVKNEATMNVVFVSSSNCLVMMKQTRKVIASKNIPNQPSES